MMPVYVFMIEEDRHRICIIATPTVYVTTLVIFNVPRDRRNIGRGTLATVPRG